MKAADYVYKHRQKTERGRRSEARWGKNINKKTKKNYDFAWLSVFLAFSRGCVANKKRMGRISSAELGERNVNGRTSR